MANIRPFSGIYYTPKSGQNLSDLIAPPYDVLDETGKAKLVARSPHNIVTVDLPFLPPKSVGPDEVYAKANITLESWLHSGVLKRDARAAIYPYTQSYAHGERTFHRRGFICLVKLEPFHAGHIIPHEKTYKGPIEDRLKLMHATQMQLSPIFGLFSDNRGEITKKLYENAGRPMLDATLDGVRSQLWSVIDAEVEDWVIGAMGTKHIYIADGHHRYTTALQYQKDTEAKNGGPLPANHPANYCLFVLVSLQDDGLLILPTHRLIGGLSGFNIDALKQAVAGQFDVIETTMTAEEVCESITTDPPHTFGLYNAATKKSYKLRMRGPDVLMTLEPNQSPAWRKLDVAILQRYLLDEIIGPNFGGGKELTKGYTAYANEVAAKTDGRQFQIALMLRPTPLPALEELGRTKEVMPQKSTFFFPKLATGMVMNSLKVLKE